ncbi:hypothetical protein [Streptomyces sp. NPDC056192]|uniref:hypothetical protein n=1 Tax=Streptomyces sp. NPDC056192 TaxID=3345743 RepID=UPI0035DF423F
MTDRIPLGNLTADALASLYDERDQYATALKRIRDRRKGTRELELLGVRRFGEDETTPVVIDGREPCGLFSDHARLGCLGLPYTDRAGQYGLIHLTAADALRLADLLRAMSDTAEEPNR